jgi:hypothetical protein
MKGKLSNEAAVAYLRNYAYIFLQTDENNDEPQSGQPVSGPRFEPGTTEYEACVLTNRPRRSVS